MRDHRISDPYQIYFILDYCKKIQCVLKRIQYDKTVFEENYEQQDLLSFYLMQIGEHANNISKELREETQAQMQWKQIRGMRNRIAHAYRGVDMQIVWAIVLEEIPTLQQFCEAYLKDNPTIEDTDVTL